MRNKDINSKSRRWMLSLSDPSDQSSTLKKKFAEGKLKDRREHERHEINHKLVFSVLGPDTSVPLMEAYGHSINTSEGGLCIGASEKVDCPKMLQIDLQLHEPPYHTIILSEALRCVEDPDTGVYQLGVMFLGEVSPDVKEKL